MPKQNETFFATIGCMDGRVQKPVAAFGRQKFGAQFPDTITEAGLVGKLAKEEPDQELLESIKNKLDISLEKHHSRGVIVHGHQECAALSGVDDGRNKDYIRKSIEVVRSLSNSSVPVVGAFIRRSARDPNIWEAEEISPTVTV